MKTGILIASFLWGAVFYSAVPRTSITQWGITWTFDQAYDIGQFVNGNQGYDEQLGRYRPNFDVSRNFPCILSPGQSLVSTVTWVPGDPGCPDVNTTVNAPRPTGRKSAVLACLEDEPPTGLPYAETDTPLHIAITM